MKVTRSGTKSESWSQAFLETSVLANLRGTALAMSYSQRKLRIERKGAHPSLTSRSFLI